MTPGPTLTVPEVSPSAAIACRRVIPAVGFSSAWSASFLIRRNSDVTFVPSFHLVGPPALVLDVELRAALRDPVVHQSDTRRIVGFSRDGVVTVGALEADLAGCPRVGEHRHPALLALERAVGLQLAQRLSDLHGCGPSSSPATLCRTALASGRGAFSHRIRAARPHWRDPETSAADPGKEGGTTACVHTSSCISSSPPPTKSV